MKLNAVVRVFGDPKEICACFEPELADEKRSNFKITKNKDCVLFEIEAEDSVALRATLNSVTKLLTVYEKLKGL